MSNRNTHDGRLYRTANNLDVIMGKAGATAHPVTQLLMSLMWQLAIVLDYQDHKSKAIKQRFLGKGLPAQCAMLKVKLEGHLGCSMISLSPCDLTIRRNEKNSLLAFFRRLRNALAHGNYSFDGPDPESSTFGNVHITFTDGIGKKKWKLHINAAELYKIQQWLELEMTQ